MKAGARSRTRARLPQCASVCTCSRRRRTRARARSTACVPRGVLGGISSCALASTPCCPQISMAAWLCAPRPPPCGARLRARSVAGMRARLPPRAAPLPLRRFTAPPRSCARLLVLLAAALGAAGCAERSLCRRALAPARLAFRRPHACRWRLLARGEGVQWRNDQDHSARGVRDRVLRGHTRGMLAWRALRSKVASARWRLRWQPWQRHASRRRKEAIRCVAQRCAANDAFCEDEGACADGLTSPPLAALRLAAT